MRHLLSQIHKCTRMQHVLIGQGNAPCALPSTVSPLGDDLVYQSRSTATAVLRCFCSALQKNASSALSLPEVCLSSCFVRKTDIVLLLPGPLEIDSRCVSPLLMPSTSPYSHQRYSRCVMSTCRCPHPCVSFALIMLLRLTWGLVRKSALRHATAARSEVSARRSYQMHTLKN
jgi:hypothetical protein